MFSDCWITDDPQQPENAQKAYKAWDWTRSERIKTVWYLKKFENRNKIKAGNVNGAHPWTADLSNEKPNLTGIDEERTYNPFIINYGQFLSLTEISIRH